METNGSGPANPFLGDFLVVRGGQPAPALLEALDRRGWPQLGSWAAAGQCRQIAPGLSVCWRGGATFTDRAGKGGIGLYHLAAPPGEAPVSAEAAHGELVGYWERDVPTPPRRGGSFGAAFWDAPGSRLAVLTDPFRTYPLYYTADARVFACATDLRLLIAARLVRGDVDPVALYHYLNFGYVPGPWSILAGVHKVPPGSLLEVSESGIQVSSYWDPCYPEDLVDDGAALAESLREKVVETVSRYQPASPPRWGAFLSGGNDSSAVAGILSARISQPLDTFSIVFAEGAFDERFYVEIAARHFRLTSHLRQVEASEAFGALPGIIEAFDEPFGNASAIPTFLCAAMAETHDVRVLVAGDGGDEIFGGNERYRRDRILGWYHRTPRALRWAAESLAGSFNIKNVRLANRFRNFVHRGALANPERFYSDDAFASEYFTTLLSDGLRSALRRHDSLDVVRAHFSRPPARSELHRLMYVDLKMAISDCDLVKVTRASKRAGVAVSFPFLDTQLVDYTGRLPTTFKMRRLEKRYLFKRALEPILPREILAKKKQGFGLPFSVWLRDEPVFRDFFRDVVLSERAKGRGYFEPGFIGDLLAHHQAGGWDHGNHLFALLALELWHRAYVD